MLDYYVRLSFVSLRRAPALTSLIVLAIAIGVSMTMTAFTILYVMAGDPIPSKSRQLFNVQIDNGGPQSRPVGDDEPATQLTYRDAMALLAAHQAKRQTAMHQMSLLVTPADGNVKPFSVFIRSTTADFFPMFAVPLQYGRAWSSGNESENAAVVVLSKKLNERLFQGRDSTGQSVQLGDDHYQVIGVLQEWDPKPRYYDVIGGQNFDEGEDAYLPLPLTIARDMSTSEYEICDAGPRGKTFQDLLDSECVWLQFWAELPSSADASRYRDFLVNYAHEQQRLGRFSWPANVRLQNVRDWLVAQKVVPNDARLSLLVASGFLIVCLVSALGLMLAKAFGQSAEVGVRRALGASGRDIFAQSLIESAVTGLAGGTLGLGFTALSLWAVRDLFPSGLGRIAQMDVTVLIGTVLLALTATLITGIYPAWQAMHTAPGLQLKGG
jgi:putative ABC transport system permease protein